MTMENVDQIKNLLDPTNWKLTYEQYDDYCDYTGGGGKDNEKVFLEWVSNYNENFDDKVTITWEEFKIEMLVRGLLDGWLVEQVFTG